MATLQCLIQEMEARTKTLTEKGFVSLSDAEDSGNPLFPRFVVFIDELADLFMQDKKIEPLVSFRLVSHAAC